MFDGVVNSLDQIIHPVFDDLTLGHREYTKIFRDFSSWYMDISAQGVNGRELRDQLEDRRLALMVVRTHLYYALGVQRRREAATGPLPSPVRSFLWEVRRYFHFSAGDHREHANDYVSLLDLMDAHRRLNPEDRVKKVSRYARKTVWFLEAKWGDVTDAYAAARVKCLRDQIGPRRDHPWDRGAGSARVDG
jgi:hypothetical protein